MARQPHHYSFSNRRKASAIIGALVMAGIMAMAVGVMLSTSNNAIRRSGEKIAYEEAYQMALAGTHITRAWIINPKLASTMAGSTAAAEEIDELTTKAIEMNQQIAADVEARLKVNPNDSLQGLNLYGTQRFANAGITFEGSQLTDGRHVVYTLPVKPILNIPESAEGEEFNDSLFKSQLAKGNTNYVEWVRITTPGTTAETSASLRECTFIVEAKGVSEYGGKRKERVVQQRVLVKPNEPANPLVGATEAILTNNIVQVKGNSSANIHWGPVLAKGDLNLDFIDPIVVGTDSSGKKTFEIKFNQDKANLAGARVYESGNGSNFNNFMDKDLEWRTGVNGKLLGGSNGNNNVPLFQNVSNAFPNVPMTEFDFFHEMGAGTFGGTPGKVDQLASLNAKYFSGTDYVTGQQTQTSAANGNGLFEYNDADGTYTGALIQGSKDVDERIDSFFTEMNYETLRAYAEEHAAYYVWDGRTLTNVATGKKGLTPMTMSGSDPLAKNAPPDQMLFVDSVAQDPSKPFTDAFQLPGFWKGVVYVNGPMKFPGTANSQTVDMRSPEQFERYRAGLPAGTDIKSSSKVLADGIIICNGVANVDTGGGVIYGTLAAKGGVGVGANFSIFYNPANAEGRLRDTSSDAQPFGLIAGKLYETKVPAS